MPKRTVKAISAAFSELSTLNRLKAEVDLLTRYSSDVIYRLRYDNMQYDYISPAVSALLGYSPEELQQLSLRSLIIETRIISNNMRPVESYNRLEENRKRGEVGKWQADYLMRTKAGEKIWVSDVSYPWFDKKGAIVGSIGTLRDITDRIEAEKRLLEDFQQESVFDVATSLANRQSFWGRFEDEIRRLKRTKGDLSLLLVDIDNAEKLQETYGESALGEIILGIAGILRSTVREVDLAARLGHTEFAVILPETHAGGAMKSATRIRDAVARHVFQPGEEPICCTVSVGLASTRLGHAIDAVRLYKLADMRRYIAKYTGGNRLSADDMLENMH